MQRFKEILRRLLFPGAAVVLYTFYTTIMAVVNLVRDRKSGSPVMARRGASIWPRRWSRCCRLKPRC